MHHCFFHPFARSIVIFVELSSRISCLMPSVSPLPTRAAEPKDKGYPKLLAGSDEKLAQMKLDLRAKTDNDLNMRVSNNMSIASIGNGAKLQDDKPSRPYWRRRRSPRKVRNRTTRN
jgi:hypothetical protein